MLTLAAPTLDGCADWADWLRGWATILREAVGPVGEAFVETIRTQVGDESLAVAADGLERLVSAGFSPAEAGHALWLATRIACTAGPAGSPAISAPLQETKQFPLMVCQMIAVGEQTGALDQMLSKIADFYEDEVDTAVNGMMKLIEPLMIVVLGVIIGIIVISMYLPMFAMFSKIG